MSSGQMPTEMEAVAFNLHEVARALSAELAAFPDHVAAALDWKLSAEQAAVVAVLVRDLGLRARLLEFSLESLSLVLASQAEDDRVMFAHSMWAVDNCRLARAIHTAEPMPSPATAAAALNAAEESLANMQGVLRRRFPGEEFPGA